MVMKYKITKKDKIGHITVDDNGLIIIATVAVRFYLRKSFISLQYEANMAGWKIERVKIKL